MDLTQLANLGEFIGGVAVLVTLIYLAMQMRQSAQAQQQANELARADAMYKSTTAFSAARQMRADEEINAIWLKAVKSPSLQHSGFHKGFAPDRLLYTQEVGGSSLSRPPHSKASRRPQEARSDESRLHLSPQGQRE